MLTKDNLELGCTSEAMNSVATNKMPIIAMAMRNFALLIYVFSHINNLQERHSRTARSAVRAGLFFQLGIILKIIMCLGM